MHIDVYRMVIGLGLLAWVPGSSWEKQEWALGFQGNPIEDVSETSVFGKGVRSYSAQLRSFLAFDGPAYSPWGPGGLNPPAYVQHDSINRSDSHGHMWEPSQGEQATGKQSASSSKRKISTAAEEIATRYRVEPEMIQTLFSAGGRKAIGEAYDAGHKTAYDAAYKTGHEEGRKMGYDAGHKTAYDVAYKTGHEEGRKMGYEEGRKMGYDVAYKTGHEEGRKMGYEEGRKMGYEEGRKMGYEEGRKMGYEAQGYHRGLQHGILPGLGLGILATTYFGAPTVMSIAIAGATLYGVKSLATSMEDGSIKEVIKIGARLTAIVGIPIVTVFMHTQGKNAFGL